MINKIILFVTTINCLWSSSGNNEGTWFDDWLYPDTGLYIWSVITFLIVCAILSWKAWRPLMHALDERESQIRESLDKAEKIVKDQEKSSQENEALFNKAREEAKELIAQAKVAGEKLQLKLEKDGHEKYENLVTSATDKIESEKNKALNDIKKMVVEVAIEASEKIVKRNLNDDDNKRMVEETVDSFQNKD